MSFNAIQAPAATVLPAAYYNNPQNFNTPPNQGINTGDLPPNAEVEHAAVQNTHAPNYIAMAAQHGPMPTISFSDES